MRMKRFKFLLDIHKEKVFHTLFRSFVDICISLLLSPKIDMWNKLFVSSLVLRRMSFFLRKCYTNIHDKSLVFFAIFFKYNFFLYFH